MEFSSKKYMILLVTICIVFVIFIVKAFDYLPDKSVEANYQMINNQPQNINTIVNDNNVNDNKQEQAQEIYDPDRHKSGHIDFMPKPKKEEYSRNDYEEIKAPSGTYEEDIHVPNNNQNYIASPEEQAMKSIVSAIKYKSNYDYANALNELQKVPELTTDKELTALSYEKIAEIYAIQKRYGTALSFAGKAYSASPNVNREMLIARIYYQSGETDNAISRMNAILSKGFRD